MNPVDLARERFKPYRAAAERHERAQRALVEGRARVERLQAELAQARRHDQEQLADALVDGKSPPAPKAERLQAELEVAERQVEALVLGLDRAAQGMQDVLAENAGSWVGQSIRATRKAEQRYRDAIAELAAAREALSAEASLAVWITSNGEQSANAANALLGGRGMNVGGRPPLSFVDAVRELEADAEHLANHVVDHDAPQARPRFELIRRAEGWS